MRGIRSTTEALERCACSTAAGDSYSEVKYYCKKKREHQVTLAGITFQRVQLPKPPNHSYPCSSTAPRWQHRNHPLPQWHQNPACFVRNGGGAGARNPERVLSNLMLIKEAWKAARSRWLGTHDQMSTHFLETNIYK